MILKQAKKPADTTEKRTALDEIRQEEAKVESLVLLAEQEAVLAKQNAQNEAEQIKDSARQAGLEAGHAQYETSLDAARREADQIIAEAQAQADRITQHGQEHILDAACWAANIVLGAGGEKPSP